jgi:hypothetical protein
MHRRIASRVRAIHIWLMAPLLGLTGVLVVMVAVSAPVAQAATANTNLNFQARLLTSTGGIVPDGSYNIEFKIYKSLSANGSAQGVCVGGGTDDCLWVETRTGGNVVSVVNGYFSVNLGSVNAFTNANTTINWDNQLWLTMRIGGTGAPSWDAEMTNSGNRIQLTGVPLAFRANALAVTGTNEQILQFANSTFGQTTTISLPDPGATTATVCYQNAAACGFATGTTGSYIQNQVASLQAANFKIQSAANGSVGGTIEGTAGQTADLFDLINGATSNTVVSIAAAGGTTFQNSTDSSSGFSIKNSGGTSFFSADTTNLQINTGNLQSTGTITLQNSQGASIQLRTVSSSSTGLTPSGGVLNDATRSLALQGDGRQPPDSSTGIWESTTNMLTDGGFENITSGWTASSANTTSFTSDNSTSKFGTYAAKVVVNATGASGIRTTGTALTSGQPYAAGVWVKATSGKSMILQLVRADFATVVASQGFTGTGNWQYITTSTASYPATETGYVFIKTTAAGADTFWADGVQLENKSYSTPYVETNGGTANRTGSKVAISGVTTSTLSPSAGWMAARLRMGFPSTVLLGGTNAIVFSLDDGTNNNRLQLIFRSSTTPANAQWQIRRCNAGTCDTSSLGVDVFNAGDLRTVVLKWDASNVYFSLNGANFATTATAQTVPSVSILGFGDGGLGGNAIDSDILWATSGTGTLTNTDASSLYKLGASDPTVVSINTLDTAAVPTLAWDGEGTAYTGNNASYVSQSQLTLDDVSLTHSANGSLTLQGATNSSTAFQVQDSSGNSFLIVDTSTPGVSIGATGSSTKSSTIHIADTNNATGTQSVTIGTNVNAANAVNIEAGNTGKIQIGNTDVAHTIQIGTAGNTTVQTVTVGSNNTQASTTLVQGGNSNTAGSEALRLQTAAAGGIAIGTATQTGTITLGQATTASTQIINIESAAGTGSTQTVNIAAGTSTTSGGKVVNIATGAPGTSTTNQVNIGNGGTTSAGTVAVTIGSIAAAGHTTLIQGGNGGTAVSVQAATSGTILLGTVNANTVTLGNNNSATVFSADSGTATTNLFNSNSAHTVQLATGGGGTTVQSVTVGAATNSASLLTLQGGNSASAISLLTGNNGTTTAGGIQIGNTAGAFSQTISIGTNATSGATNVIHVGDASTATDTITIGSSSNVNNGVSIDAGNTGTIAIGTSTTAHTINIGTGGTSTQVVNVGSINAGSNVQILGGTGGSAISVQAGTSGTISVGTSNANTLTLGNNNSATVLSAETGTGTTQLFNGATAHTVQLATGGAIQAVTIGSTNTSSATTIQAGTGSLNLTASGSSNTGIIAKTSVANSTSAFQVQNAAAAPIFVVDTTSTDNTGAQVNYLTYPGFESGSFSNAAAGWAAVAPASLAQNSNKQHAYNGLFSAQVTTTSSNGGLNTTSFTSSPATGTYLISFYAKITAGANMASTAFTVQTTDGATHTCSPAAGITLSTATVGFQRLFCQIITTGAITALQITQNDGVARTIYIDSVQLQLATFNGAAITTPSAYQIGAVQIRGIITNPLTLENNANSTAAFQVQNTSTNTVLGVDTLNGQVLVGTASALTGSIKLYNSGAAGSVAIQSASQGANNFTLSVLALSGNANVCTTDAVCYAGATTDNYLVQVPTSNSANAAGADVINPTAAGITGITVNSTNNVTTGATAAIINQSLNVATASVDGLDVNSTNTANTVANGIKFTQSGTGITNNGISINQTGGTLNNGLVFSGAIGTDIVGSGKGVNITAAGASTWQTTSGNLTLQATAASSQVTVDSGSSGTVNLANTNATTIAVGGASGSTTTIGGGNVTHTIHIGDGATGTNTITIGTTNSTSTTTVQAGTGNLHLLGTQNVQIENSAGTAFVIADTTNLQLNTGNLQSTGTVTLQNQQGASIQLRTVSSTTATALTESNVITDTTPFLSNSISLSRAASLQGDGRQPPDSSTGVWQGATNYVVNGGAENDLSGWSTGLGGSGGTASNARVSTSSKFGSRALEFTSNKPVGFWSYSAVDVSGAIPFNTSSKYTTSFWAKAGSGNTISSWQVIVQKTDGTNVVMSAQTFVLTNSWQHFVYTFTPAVTGVSTTMFFTPVTANQTGVIDLDGVQLENTPVVSPYVETTNAAASRGAARVQAPSVGLGTSSQGWVAMRFRTNFGRTDVTNFTNQEAHLFDWEDGSANQITAYFNSSGNLVFSRTLATGANATYTTPAFSSGASFTVLYTWTSTQISYLVTVNGASSGFVSTANTPAAFGAMNSTFDIGTMAGARFLNGDVMWLGSGSGTLLSGDATTISQYGNSDPTLANLQGLNSGTSLAGFAWDGESAQYTGTNGAYTNQSQLSLDDVNLTHAGNGSLVLQGATNSTAAFQVQDNAGNSFLTVDTSTPGVSIGATGSSTKSSTIHIADTNNATGTQAVTIGTNVNTANTVSIDAGTAANSIAIGNSTTAHSISIGSGSGTAVTQTINIGNGTSTTSGGVAVNIANGLPGASTTNQVNIGSTGTTTGTVAVTIGSVGATGHTTLIQGGNGSTAIVLQAANSGTIVIGSQTASTANTINIGAAGSTTNSDNVSINNTSGTNTGTIILGGTGAASGQITIGQATTANNTISIGSGNLANVTQTVNIANGTSATGGGELVNIANGIPGASTTNQVNIGTAGTNTGTVAVKIGSIGAAGHTTLIQGGNAGTAISLQAATSGTILVGTTNVNTVTVGSTANTGTLTFGQSTAGETINISNGATAANTTVSILSGAGSAGTNALHLADNTRVNSITIGNINPAAARTIAIGNTTGTANAVIDTINIATNPTTVAGGNTVHIADGTPTGSGTNLVTVGSLANASASTLQAGTGGLGLIANGGSNTGVTVKTATSNSTAAFQVQNSSNQNVLAVNTSTQQVAIGPAAVPANGVLTVGTNSTTTAPGGAYFGTDTDLYRSGVGALTTDGHLLVGIDLTVPLIKTASGNLQIQPASGLTQFNTASIDNEVRIYGSGGTNYATLSYNNATSSGILSVNTGTVKVGSGSGPINILSGAGAAITITANAASTWSTTSGILTLQGAGGLSFNSNIVTDVNIKENSTTAFQVQNSSALSLFTIDTTNQKVTVNQSQAYVVGSSLLSAPGVAAGANTGGTLSGSGSTTYYYRMSAITPTGEIPSASASINGLSFTGQTPPGAPTTAAPSAGGGITLGTHSYVVTFVGPNGETSAGTVSSVVNVTTGGTQTEALTGIPTGPAGTLGRNIYRTVTGNTGSYYRLSTGTYTVSGNVTTTYSDSLPDSNIGGLCNPGCTYHIVAAPVTNTDTTNTNNATITFSAVTGATGYRVYRSTDNENYAYQTTASSPFTDTGAAGTAASPAANSRNLGLSIGTNTSSASLTVAGDALFQNAIDTTTALQIKDASGSNLFVVDSANKQLTITSAKPTTTSTSSVSGVATTAELTNPYTGANVIGTQYSKTIISSTDGFPRIVAYDSTNAALDFIRCLNYACTKATTTAIDNSGSDGQYPSIAQATVSGSHVYYVAYYDATNTALKYLECTSEDCTSHTTGADLDSPNTVGQYTAIGVNGLGFPSIAYYDATNTAVRYLECTAADCSTFAAPVVADNAEADGQYLSMVMTPDDGFATIGYWDATDIYPKTIHCTTVTCSSTITGLYASGGSGDPAGFGQNTSMTLNPVNGFPVFSFQDTVAPVTYDWEACGNDACSTIITGSDLSSSNGNTVDSYGSVAVSSTGTVYVAFYANVTELDMDLYCHNIYSIANSCNDIGGDGVIAAVDSTGTVGQYPTVAVGTDGHAHIAYYDATNTNLKVASWAPNSFTATGINLGSGSSMFANVYASNIQGGSISLAPTVDSENTLSVVSSTGANVLQVSTSTQKVCIDTTTCSHTFGVNGTIGASGAITGSSTPDIAETIPAAADVTAADVVSVDPNSTERAIKSQKSYDSTVLGVVSDGTSTFMINARAHDENAPLNGVPLVLAGRVPVKVSTENGPVLPGDYLTSSSTPGVAMKATHFGPTIGKALGFFGGADTSNPATGTTSVNNQQYSTGAVLVLVNISTYNAGVDLQGGGSADLDSLTLNTLTVNTSALFKGDITLAAHVIGNSDTTGTLTIAGGQTSAAHTFVAAYSITPKVVAAPDQDVGSLRWWIVKTPSSFTIYLSGSAPSSMNFDYMVQGTGP